MTEEEKSLLEKAVNLSEDNNKMLKSITRSMRISRIISVIYWIIIIGSAVGVFYLIQPYIDFIINAYSEAKNNLSGGVSGILDLIQ
jgi:hypothetical protein